MENSDEAEVEAFWQALYESAGDTESSHQDADRFMYDFLRRHGFPKLAAVYESLPKWFS